MSDYGTLLKLHTLHQATVQRKQADVEWREAVRAAAVFHSLSAVAESAGVTRQRVHQIVNGA